MSLRQDNLVWGMHNIIEQMRWGMKRTKTAPNATGLPHSGLSSSRRSASSVRNTRWSLLVRPPPVLVLVIDDTSRPPRVPTPAPDNDDEEEQEEEEGIHPLRAAFVSARSHAATLTA